MTTGLVLTIPQHKIVVMYHDNSSTMTTQLLLISPRGHQIPWAALTLMLVSMSRTLFN